jgi:benzoyl-CoA reductase/2-hydroxyglutaryl-CoA dehydratase subunit BcrC/BadD/HgdB
MKKVGYLCTFTPKEMIWAAGFLPVRILADNQPVSLANSHIQSYSCSQARGSLERLLKGDLDLYGVVFTRSCDTLMRLADIWEKNSDMRVYNLEFPTKINNSTKNFFKKELLDFKSTLEEWTGREIGPKGLIDSIRLYNRLEELLARIFRISPDYELITRAETESPKKIVEEAEKRLKEIEKRRGNKKTVLVTGSVCPFPEVMQFISDAGFHIVDDLCTGTRFFTYEGIENDKAFNETNIDSAIEFLATKYFVKAPCPTKNYEKDRRYKYVIEKAKDVDAVIFLLLKFCEPHFFDYPQLREKLEAMGKRTLLLELEFPVSEGQLRTRIEAFYETVSEG